MIVSFRHAGLRELFETGKSRKVQPDLHKRCRRAMDAIQAATALSDLRMPGWSVHPLKGNRGGRHAMAVSGPWRITLRWDRKDAHELDLEQYHGTEGEEMATTKTMKGLPVRLPLKRAPTHPGEILREDVLPALRMNVSQAARELGVSRQLLHRILGGKAPVTPEMAVRLGKWAGNGPALWLGMQQAFDVWHAEQALGAELKRIPGHAA